MKIAAWCDKAERSHWDVRNKLIDWWIPHVERETLISFLIEKNLLNEERFAKAFAHDKFAFHHWGPKKISYLLKLKGVSERNIKIALKEIETPDIAQTIRDLIKKKEPQHKGLQLYQKKMKLARFLIGKGFDSQVVWDELERIIK